jgi:CBS domain-containing protein
MTIRKLVEGRDFEVVTCETTATMRDAIAILAERRIGALPVMENGEVAGIFSERDVVYRIQELGPAALDSSLGSVMTSPAVTVDPDTSVLSALSLMTRRRIRHLPVVENGRMTAFVSIGDLVKQRIDKIESEAEALRTYIQTA